MNSPFLIALLALLCVLAPFSHAAAAPAPANPRDQLQHSSRCGNNWNDANQYCGTLCANDGACNHGDKCFGGLDAIVCHGGDHHGDDDNEASDETSSAWDFEHSSRCGNGWNDAASSCGVLCSHEGSAACG
ncbi:hypothetical protein HDU98_000208, partial [Podochytrium sp. JEL0797]